MYKVLSLPNLLRALAAFCLSLLCIGVIAQEKQGWLLIDNFEGKAAIEAWQKADTRNETDPFVPKPQLTELRVDVDGNQYLIKKPAADGIVGNRKALTFKPLPQSIPVGEIFTVYSRFQVESFPNNHVFGLSNLDAKGIIENDYNALEPSIRITDKAESNGYKNDGTLMVKVGKGYKKAINFKEARIAQALKPGIWYEAWMVVDNKLIKDGGQVYDVYLKGGEFTEQTAVYLRADFRMHREQDLGYFMMNCNTGPKKAPYGNGGIFYDDLYMSAGVNLSNPIDSSQ